MWFLAMFHSYINPVQKGVSHLPHCKTMIPTLTLYVGVGRPATWQAVAPCTLWTMQVKDLDTVVDLYPDLAPLLQEAFHQHLKNQAKRTPGKAW